MPGARASLETELELSEYELEDYELEDSDDTSFGREIPSWPTREEGNTLSKLFPELGRTYEPRKAIFTWYGSVPRGYSSDASRGGQLLTRTKTFAVGGIVWLLSVRKPHWDPTASPSTSCRNPDPTGSLPLGEEPAACLHLTAVQARRRWHMEDVVTVRLGVSFLPASNAWQEVMKAEGMEPATWMRWLGLELKFTSQQPTHSFMLPGWTEEDIELRETFEKRFKMRDAKGDTTSRQPFIAHLEFQDPEVSWHDLARHEEAEDRRALSPALTLYRSLEVLGLESLMCGDCGAGSRPDRGGGFPLSISVDGTYGTSTEYDPLLRYTLHSLFETSSPAETLAGALHACNEECPAKGGTKQLIRDALLAATEMARDLVSTPGYAQKDPRLHGWKRLLPLPRLPLVSDVGCCTAQPVHYGDSEEGDKERERLSRKVKALAKAGSEGQALQLALEALAWSSDTSLQPVASSYCLTEETAQLTQAAKLYVSQSLVYGGKVPAEITKKMRSIGAHVHPSHPSFGNLSPEARAWGCRPLALTGNAAKRRQIEDAARASLWELGRQVAMVVWACGLCIQLLLDVNQLLLVAEIPLIPLRLVWLALSGVWTLLRGSASRGEGRKAHARAASDNGRTEPASPRAADGSGKGRKGPAAPPSTAASKSSKGAATPGAGGSRGAVKSRSGSADAAGPSAAATANGGSGRQQPAPQQPPAPPPQPQQHNAKPAGGKKRRGSSAYGPSGAAPNGIATLTSTLLHSAISEPSTPLPAAAPASAPSSQPSTAPAPQPYQSSASAAAAFAPAWDFMPPPPAAAGSASTAAAAGTAPAPVSSSAPDDDDDASRLCVMCLDGPRRFGFLHGTTVHTGVCEECSALLQGCMPGLECPLCRVRVETIVALF